MRRTWLQASSGLRIPPWPGIDWAGGYRRVRALQRRLVQAVQRGAWRKGKRLRDLLVHSLAARALAVKRVTEDTGKKTPGVEGERGETPEQKAAAVIRIGQWRQYQPHPLKRVYISKSKGTQRPLSIPTLEDRARQALYRGCSPLPKPGQTPTPMGFDPSADVRLRLTRASKSCARRPPSPGSWKGTLRAFSTPALFPGLKTTLP